MSARLDGTYILDPWMRSDRPANTDVLDELF